jgi:hypothetical protein
MPRPKDPELERLWRQRLLRHSTSGLSISEFCSRAGVPDSSFYYWKRRLASGPCPAPRQPPLFIPLQLQGQPHEGRPSVVPSVEIELPHHVIRCQFIFSRVIRSRFISSGKNDEQTPDFPELTPDFPVAARSARR